MPEINATAVEQAFKDNFISHGELGAALSIWQHGKEVVSLAHGWTSRERTKAWTTETLVPVWSATKGAAALTCLLAMHEASLTLDTPVVDIWPEFFLYGKESITLSHILSHRAGLWGMTERVSIYDYDAVIDSLERQAPLAEPDQLQAYHARTWGFLLDELVRRITGADSLGAYFHEIVAQPLQLDAWIGLPNEEHSRVATLYPGRMNLGSDDQAFLKAFQTQGTKTHHAFTSPIGLESIHEMNKPETWLRGYPALGGIASARGLAAMYDAILHQPRIIPNNLLPTLTTPLTQAHDEVLQTQLSFSAGFMLDPVDAESGQKRRQLFGPSHQSFGHPGAGGSLAFADPENDITFAYVMNQMEAGVLPGPKVTALVKATYEER
jgi:CubicO group peptidase (beta-lactamase class C family)